VGLFVLLTLTLPPEDGLFSSNNYGGSCSGLPLGLYFYVPVQFGGLLGFGFSAIRLFEMESRKQKDKHLNEPV
jgi:hypothetical protein